MTADQPAIAQCDVVIAGGGFAGLALAIALKQGLGDSFSVTVADPALGANSGDDLRASAIAAAARRMFETIGVWDAVAAATSAVRPGGLLFIALYNDLGTKSQRWRGIKRLYNRVPRPLRPLLTAATIAPQEAKTIARLTLSGRPLDYLKLWTRHGVRGMNRWRDAVDWVPEFSRRARGIPVYATLRALGRSGVADLVDRCCERARQFADLLARDPGVRILNDVVLNQVLVRYGDDDATTRAVIAGVQADGTCWASGTTWHGLAAMRISVSNWATSEADVAASAAAMLRVFRQHG